MKEQGKTPFSYLLSAVAWIALAGLFWHLRSWNLEIGDGIFICKQTVGETPFDITLSRSFLSYLLYRFLFFNLHPVIGWWVEDIIALSSCAAGLLYIWSLNRLSLEASRTRFERWMILLLPSTTLTIQLFCGHIEFYSWTNALMMLCAYWCWKSIHQQYAIWIPSVVLALAAGFHTSGIFYFPTLLLLPLLTRSKRVEIGKADLILPAVFLLLFLVTALLHRFSTYYIVTVIFAVPLYYYTVPKGIHDRLIPWFKIYLPWFFLFTLRASLGLYSEPLWEHVPPFREPYDPNAYLYMAISWDHLFDKTMFHLWLAPFGLPVIAILGYSARRVVATNRWLLFLIHFCFWAMVWSVIFYPQLRLQDWDLFASMSVPLNLFAGFLCIRVLLPKMQRWLLPSMIVIQLFLSLPVIISNSGLLDWRGYCTLNFESSPVSADFYIRQLKIGETPGSHKHIRTGPAVIRMIPKSRDYESWATGVDLIPGETYNFQAEFNDRRHSQLIE